jgi:anti-anti-sigma factor
VLVAGRWVQHGGEDPDPEEARMPAPTCPTAIEIRRDAGRTVVAVRGEIDLSTVADFEDALCEVSLTADGPVEIDLSGLTYLDCRALAALANCRETLTARRQGFVLRGSRRRVRAILAHGDLQIADR